MHLVIQAYVYVQNGYGYVMGGKTAKWTKAIMVMSK